MSDSTHAAPAERRGGRGPARHDTRAHEHEHHVPAATWAEAKAEQDEFEAALVAEHGDWGRAVEDVIEGRTPEHPPPAPGPPA